MEVLYHDENSNSAECKQQGHGDEAVSVNHSGNQKAFFILMQCEQTRQKKQSMVQT